MITVDSPYPMFAATAVVLAAILVAILLELRRLRVLVVRLSRARTGVTALADIVANEDAVYAAWEEYSKVDALRPGEDRFTPQQKAQLAVERFRAKRKYDYLSRRLEQARQAEIDVRAGRKTLEEIQREFSPSIRDLMTPQAEEKRLYEEALRDATENSV